MVVALFWFVLSAVAALLAATKGRSGAGYFFLSITLSPLIGIPAALMVSRKELGAPDVRGADASKGTDAGRASVESRVVNRMPTPRARGKTSTSGSCWIPPGTPTMVRGYHIPDGMIYVGRNLPAMSEWRGVEPALIDPSLETGPVSEDGEGMDYWPSYSNIPPACRTGYLEWLAGGRVKPDTCVGYVFLFVYGLERRLLADYPTESSVKGEMKQIVAELERLLTLYAKSGSFERYVRLLLEFVGARDYMESGTAVAISRDRYGFEAPLAVRVMVGHRAAEDLPLDGPSALAWVVSDPQFSLRTPATRCELEFEQLFLHEYQEKYGAGIKLPQCKRRVQATYRPASASFDKEFALTLDLPDVTSLVGPRKRLQEITTSCTDELDSYSRLLGRNPEARESITAIALLPKVLIRSHPPKPLQDLRARVEAALSKRDMVVVEAAAILDPWLPSDDSLAKKSDAVEACRLLGQLGYGVVPDIRLDGIRFSRADKIVLFHVSGEDQQAPSRAYSAASTLLGLAVSVAAADGELSHDEGLVLREHVISALHLDDTERQRVVALLEWLTSRPARVSTAKKALSIDESDRRMAASFLVGVACVDGVANPAEVRALTRIYAQLELDPESVHQDLHSALSYATRDQGPVAVIPAGTTSLGYRVPKPEEVQGPRKASIVLSAEQIAKKQNEAAAVARMLNDVFSDETEPVGSTAQESGPTHARTYGSLDMRHSVLLARLGQQQTWSSTEFDRLVTDECQLLPGGAIEMLNECALERCNELLLEGEDVIHVNTAVYQEMLK